MPLSSERLSYDSADVLTMVKSLLRGLSELHQLPTPVLDFSPEQVFASRDFSEVVVLPSPWLSLLARRRPDELRAMQFTAPEIAQAGAVDLVRADLYGVGKLAFLLLTGKHHGADALPSDIDSNLKEWDAFIDGCCRTNPERRFRSFSTAKDALRVGPPVPPMVAAGPPMPGHLSKVPPSLPGDRTQLATSRAGHDLQVARAAASSPRPRKRRKFGKAFFLILVIAALATCYFGLDSVWDKLPIGKSSVRGFADTILTYADRSYDGSTWSQHNSVDLDTAAKEAREIIHRTDLKFNSVVGWNDRSYWVSGSAGPMLHRKDGKWSFAGFDPRLKDGVCRVANASTVYITGMDQEKSPELFRLDATGLAHLHTLQLQAVDHKQNGTLLLKSQEEMDYLKLGNLWSINVPNKRMLCLEEESLRDSHHVFEKEVGRDDRPVGAIRHIRTPSLGIGWGCVGKHDVANFRGDDWYRPAKEGDIILVRFENGRWQAKGTIVDANLLEGDVTAAWLGGPPGNPKIMVFVGSKGSVFLHRIQERETVQQSINEVNEGRPTSKNLIAVWGVDESKYWVMDSSGTIWQRSKDNWSRVVNGKHDEAVAFIDAWVAPNGNIVAITHNEIWRLE